MFFLMFVGISLTYTIAIVVPYDFVGVFLAIGGDDGLEHVASFGQSHFIENVVDIGIALADAFQLPAVQVDAGRAEVRVNGHGSLLALALRVAALRQVEHRFLAPVGLVPVEGVLARLAIEGNKALHVARIHAAALPHGHGKVERIPQVGCQDIGVLGDDAPLILVCLGLESLGIEVAAPVQGVAQYLRLMLDVGVRAIFGQHQPLPGIFLLHLLDPGLDVLYLLFVPAEVAVHALYVGILVDGILHMTVAVDGHRIAVRVLELAEVVNRLCERRRIAMRMVDFVMDAPHVDGGVVEALAYQLTHLLVDVVPLLSRDAVHERNLSPDDKAQRVATRVDVVRLLVVGEAHGRGSHLHNLCQVEVVLLVGQRAAQSPPVLMAGNAVHGILLAVQEEALACYGFVLAQTQGLHYLVDNLPVLLQARHHLIKIRIFSSLPQVRIADLEMGDIALHTLRCQVERLAMRLDQLAFAGIDGIL